MARHLNARLSILAAPLLAGAAQGVFGQEALPDPTRPPAAFIGQTARPGAAVVTGPVLQSVLLSRERKTAIIGGERVEVGGKYGEARLVRLSDVEAVLEGPEGTTVLRLLPEAERKPSAVGRGAVGKSVPALTKSGASR